MDPSTGTFTTMDTYGGSLSDPMSLHKYLFANSNPVRYSDPSGHSSSINEVNTVVGIITIIASTSTVFVYNIIGDIYGADKTQPSYWICMVVAVIIVAFLTYFTAGAFVEGVAICALGKILLGIMGLITGNICTKLSNEARVKGYELYGDLFEFASILLQTYAFNELIEGIAEGWSSLKEKISNVWNQMKSKKGYVYIGGENKYNTYDEALKDKQLDDNAIVVRGGLCTEDRFNNGSGVVVDNNGIIYDGVSVESGNGISEEELASYLNKYSKVGVTTVGEIRAIGGNVVPYKPYNVDNPYHCNMFGITSNQAEDLFTPAIPNPSRQIRG